MLKSSTWIKQGAETTALIDPFIPESVRSGVISYGLGPYGYDIRLHEEYRLPANLESLDPHNIRESNYLTKREKDILLPPGSFILGRSLEYFRIPKKILGLVYGKSTYARVGVLVNVTPLEPEWSGYLTISIANIGATPVKLHTGEGIAQVLFFESDDFPIFSYKDLNGKYNQQKDITLSKV